MSEPRPLLEVADLGKSYPTYSSNIARFARWFGAPVRPVSSFEALTGISFTLREGEAIALIGQNGAGKSTLLKTVTGTVRPTSGTVAVHGRISAILELGVGFNPEFTGRENVAMAGGLMGFSNEDLSRLMPQVEAFAEIGEYFDQPLRTYSSGMQARLAFSLATAKRPEILIVDEVLSVGDSYFQHKSFDHIRRFKEEGSAIILVTHGLADVRALCDRVLLLDKGKVLKDGAPDEVVDYYNAMMAQKESALLSVEQRRGEGGWLHTRSGSYAAEVAHIELLDADTREPVATATVGQKLVLRVEVAAAENLPSVVLGLMLRDRNGHVVWGSNTWHTQQGVENVRAGERLHFEMAFACELGQGSYSLSTAITSGDTHLVDNYEWQDNLLVFDVMNVGRPFFLGTSALGFSFSVSREG